MSIKAAGLAGGLPVTVWSDEATKTCVSTPDKLLEGKACGHFNQSQKFNALEQAALHGQKHRPSRNGKQQNFAQRPDKKPEEPYNPFIARNINELLETTPLGKLLKGKIEKVKGVVAAIDRGVPVYRIKEKIELYDGETLKKGWCFYIDREFGTEIEVFYGCKEGDRQKFVIRTNGTQNVEKTQKALDKKREFERKR